MHLEATNTILKEETTYEEGKRNHFIGEYIEKGSSLSGKLSSTPRAGYDSEMVHGQ
jgi:hypothetical protein